MKWSGFETVQRINDDLGTTMISLYSRQILCSLAHTALRTIV